MNDDSSTIWCPYAGTDVTSSLATEDHIVPLSMNGSNQLVVPASHVNCSIGSDIEGKVAREFSIGLARAFNDVRGQKRKAPHFEVKQASAAATGENLRVVFGDKRGKIMRVYNPRTQQDVKQPEQLSITVEMDVFSIRLNHARMLAKVALGLGYVEFGQKFRDHFDHDELRQILHTTSIDQFRENEGNVRVDLPLLERVGGQQQLAVLEELCRSVEPASCIAITPGPDCIAFTLGVIGKYFGTIWCPCDVDSVWPDSEDELGKFILLRERRLTKMGMLQALERLLCSRDATDVWADEFQVDRATIDKLYQAARLSMGSPSRT